METHFVFAEDFYYWKHGDKLISFIREKMKKYKIEKIIVTNISMERVCLITKEDMENFCNGNERQKESMTDNLESFFEDIRVGKATDADIGTYFLPKLTDEELEMVERKDEDFMDTFWNSMDDADVREAKMKLSESNSKFVLGYGWRGTATIEKGKKHWRAAYF